MGCGWTTCQDASSPVYVKPAASQPVPALTNFARMAYAQTLYADDGATLDDLREAMTTLEAVDRIAQRVFGSPHPITTAITRHLQNVRALLHAHEAPPSSA